MSQENSAVQKINEDMQRSLLRSIADKNKKALLMALKNGADPSGLIEDRLANFYKLTPFYLSIDGLTDSGESKLPDSTKLSDFTLFALEALYEAGADINKGNERFLKSPLFRCIEQRNKPALLWFLEHGADVNRYDCDHQTPLWEAIIGLANAEERAGDESAAVKLSWDMVELLLRYDADLNWDKTDAEEFSLRTVVVCFDDSKRFSRPSLVERITALDEKVKLEKQLPGDQIGVKHSVIRL